MLYVKRLNRYLNTQSAFLNDDDFKNGVKNKNIERILIHDDEKVLFTCKWLETTKMKSIDEISFNVSAKNKRQTDLKEKAFTIKTSYEYALSNYLTYDLYLHIDLFNFEVKKVIQYNTLYNVYTDIDNDLQFKQVIKELRKDSDDVKSIIYKLSKDLRTFNINELEKDINKIKRNIKKYQKIYETETKAIEELKETIK